VLHGNQRRRVACLQGTTRRAIGLRWVAHRIASLLLVSALVASAAGAAVGLPRIVVANGVGYQAGDVFAGASSGGTIAHFNASGTLLDTLQTGTGTAETGMCFDASGDLYTTNFFPGSMTKFGISGNVLLNPFGGPFTSDPESCVVDSAGNVWVGLVDSAALQEYSQSGSLLATFKPATESRGIDWIDLNADHCTFYYTSELSSVLSYNVCTQTQNANFATGLPGQCFALRIRQNGEVMVACSSEVVRLSTTGSILQTYPTSSLPNTGSLFALNLDPDGTSFWVADFNSGAVLKVGIASGSVLTEFTAAHGALGLAVIGAIGPSAPQSVVATPLTTSYQGGPAALTTVEVSWTAPASSGTSPITSYTVDALQNGSVVSTTTVPAPATGGTFSVPSTCTPLTTVNVTANSAAGHSAPGSSTPFADVQVPSSPKSIQFVVILMPGEGGSGPADGPYDPSSYANYCNLKNAGEPALHTIANLSFDHPGNPTPDFTDAVAALGAIILPFSYTGSYFTGHSSASFTVQAYSANDAGQAPWVGARALDKEITTAHAVYPNARIYVGGDSGAGLVETDWFGGEPSLHSYGFYSSTKYQYVGGLFTMDSPVNGTPAELYCGWLCLLRPNGLSLQLLEDLFRRWVNRDQNDQAYEAKDAGLQAVFSPVGTDNDIFYNVFDAPWSGIQSQWMCAHGSSSTNFCGPESLDFRTPGEPPEWSQGEGFAGFGASHDWLFSQPAVINYFSDSIKAGGLNANATDPSDIQASLSTNVAAPGQTVTISGSGGFGSTTGQVSFTAASNQIVMATISSWSDISIAVVVPSTAITGPVLGLTAGGVPFYAGRLAVESAANGVANISYQPIVAALSGQAETLTVTATDGSGVAVVNAVVSLTDGLGTLSCTTDSSGACSMSVVGYASRSFTVMSGTTAIQVPFTWNQPPVQSLSLSASPTILLNGGSSTVTATVTDSSGNPVVNQQVNFDASGSAHVTLSSTQAMTNSSGVATITASSPTSGVEQIEALTDDDTAGDAVQVSWSTATVSAISPPTGPSAGGTSITISGTGFASGATVYFGTSPANSVTFVNSTTLTAVSPAGSGAVDVRVGIGGSESDLFSGDVFTYVPPTVTGVSPTSGPATGGTKVTISGTNFAAGAQVKFGGTLSSAIQVTSTTSITAFSPPVAAGTVDVTVTVAGVTSATSSADQFTFTAVTTPPTVTQITPNTGPAAGGASVTVTGTNFVGGSTVSVGGNPGTNVNVQSSTTLTFTTPAGSGTVDVRVTTPAGTSPVVTADQFTYQAPLFPGMAAAGWFHNLAAKTDGTVWAWGRNNFGQLGNGTTNQSNVPVQVTNLSGAVGVAGGAYHSVALKSDGTVWAWGYNGSGQLGNGTTTNSSTPVQVSNLTGITAVAAGCNFSLALKSDGTVWDWGDNSYGQLGNGTTTNSSKPLQVSSLSGVTAIAGGCDHALALKSDGTVWTWGDNHNGQLGNGTTTNSSTPVKVTNLANVVSISGGEYHSVAAKSDGTAWAWGYNQNGQLGNGTTKQSTTPVQVSSLSNVKSVAGGGGHSLALTTSGVIWAWGLNSYGQLGNGTTTSSSTPVQVSNLTSGAMISGGVDHSIATTTAGLAWDWGNNQFGQLGNGTTSNSSTPVQVSGLTSV